jgi:uncharacterized membrane protein SpoIIM required for sporulation
MICGSGVVRGIFRVLRKGHWLLWGNILFMLASILWLAAPIVCWTTEDYYACGVIGYTATTLYLVKKKKRKKKKSAASALILRLIFILFRSTQLYILWIGG